MYFKLNIRKSPPVRRKERENKEAEVACVSSAQLCGWLGLRGQPEGTPSSDPCTHRHRPHPSQEETQRPTTPLGPSHHSRMSTHSRRTRGPRATATAVPSARHLLCTWRLLSPSTRELGWDMELPPWGPREPPAPPAKVLCNVSSWRSWRAAEDSAAATSLQSCPTLCNPTDGSPPRLPCPWDSPGKNTGVGCHFLLQCMKVKSESEVA